MPNETNPVNDAAFKAKFRDEPLPVKGRRFIVTGGTTSRHTTARPFSTLPLQALAMRRKSAPSPTICRALIFPLA